MRLQWLIVAISLVIGSQAAGQNRIVTPGGSAYWSQRQSEAAALSQRAQVCFDLQQIMGNRLGEMRDFMASLDITRYPQTGFVPRGVVAAEDKNIERIIFAAMAEYRWAMANGANVSLCRQILEYRLQQATGIIAKYPGSEAYRHTYHNMAERQRLIDSDLSYLRQRRGH